MLNRAAEDIVTIRPDEMALKDAPIARQDSSTRVIRCESLEALIQAVGYLKLLNIMTKERDTLASRIESGLEATRRGRRGEGLSDRSC